MDADATPEKEKAKRTKWINDPDFGPIEVPDVYISEEEWAQGLEEVRAGPWLRLWTDGERSTCEACGEKDTFVGRSDLTVELHDKGVVYVFFDIQGGRCEKCGVQRLETRDFVRIEDALGRPWPGIRPDYEGKVARLGSGSLGTYWPRDIQRLMKLKPQKKTRISVVTDHSVLVEFL